MTNEDIIKGLTLMRKNFDSNSVYGSYCIDCLDMAIEALEKQPKHSQNTMSKQPDSETLGIKTEKTCEDVISRQAAIDAILAVTGNSSVRELYEHVQEHGLSEMWSGGVNAAIDTIIAVPSAQPKQDREFMKLTVRNSNGGPYYSIIYLEFDDDGIGQDIEGYSSYSLDVISNYLKKYFMSPAQPEIIHCGDCIHWINKHLCEIWSRYGTIETKPDFYCGFGERINNE